MGKLAVADAFVSARYTYGPFRKTVLGFGIHMAEGGGTVGYLSRDPARGVSVHFVVEYSGRIVQMIDIANACGGLNPADRSTNKAYYGHDTLVAVLGTDWVDPNAVSIQIEVEGFAAKGPNPAQVASIVKLASALRDAIPTLRGAFGHADQTDTKACPGTTAAMRDTFAMIGGHGLWRNDAMPVAVNGGSRVLASDYVRVVASDNANVYRDTMGTVLRSVPKGTVLDDFGIPVGQSGYCYVGIASSHYDADSGVEMGIALARLSDVGPLTRKDDAGLVATAQRFAACPPPADATAAFNSGVDAAIAAADTARKP